MGRYNESFEKRIRIAVQIELNSVKMKYNEDVNTHRNRVEELCFK